MRSYIIRFISIVKLLYQFYDFTLQSLCLVKKVEFFDISTLPNRANRIFEIVLRLFLLPRLVRSSSFSTLLLIGCARRAIRVSWKCLAIGPTQTVRCGRSLTATVPPTAASSLRWSRTWVCVVPVPTCYAMNRTKAPDCSGVVALCARWIRLQGKNFADHFMINWLVSISAF